MAHVSAHPAAPPFVGGFPETRRDHIYPLADVKRGDRGIGYTVFSGDKLEPFEFEVLGIMKSMLGPGQDVILVRLEGDKIAFSGVIAGMSGSPTYLKGKLLGAVAYRFGSFSKEPIAGITPIASMLKAKQKPPTQTRDLAEHRVQTKAGAFGEATPIQTPITVSGLHPEALRRLNAEISPLGMPVVAGSQGTAKPLNFGILGEKLKPRRLEANRAGMAGKTPASPIGPGSPIAIPLIQGDITAAAVGTVTMVEGSDVYAFGHPFEGDGHVRFPMATAAVLNTLASSMGSYKQAAAAREVGSIQNDRLTAITGRLGEPAPMVPVQVMVVSEGQTKPEFVRVEVVKDPVWLRRLVGSVVFSAAASRLGYESGGDASLRAVIHVGDTPLEIRTEVSGPKPYNMAGYVTHGVSQALSQLLDNPFQKLDIRGVEVEIRLRPEVKLAALVSARVEEAELHAGEEGHLRLEFRPYRGPLITRRIPFRLPDWVVGPVELWVGSGSLLDAEERKLTGPVKPEDLDDWMELIAKRRPDRGLYLRAVLPRVGVSDGPNFYSDLPPSLQLALEPSQEVSPKPKSLGPSWHVPLDAVVVGLKRLNLNLEPQS